MVPPLDMPIRSDSAVMPNFRALASMTIRLAAVCLCLMAGCQAGQQAAFREILLDQMARYPAMEVQDLYKFVHQATLGPAHAAVDTAAARAWLRREINSLRTVRTDEPEREVLRPDGQLVRVNLRPYVASGHDVESLLRAFVENGETLEGTLRHLEYYWGQARELAALGKLPFSVSEMDSLFERQAAQGHPAIHHTQAYTRAYAPAYRVVNAALLAERP